MPTHYLRAPRDIDVEYLAAIRQAYYAGIVNFTRRFSDDAVINYGERHGNLSAGYDLVV